MVRLKVATLVELWAARLRSELLKERWITKEGRAIFIGDYEETPPNEGEAAGMPEEHDAAAEAHKRAAEAYENVGDHAAANKHRTAMMAHQRAAEAVRAAREASAAADFAEVSAK